MALALLVGAGIFANTIAEPITPFEKQSENLLSEHPTYYACMTSCGVTVFSASWEPVSNEDLMAWGEAMEEYYCEQL